MSDNGTEFRKHFQKWLKKKGIKILKTKPRDPHTNGTAERTVRYLTFFGNKRENHINTSLKCKATGLTRQCFMEAFENKVKNPDHWQRVNKFAQSKMLVAREALIREKARSNAKIIPSAKMKVLLPEPKNSGLQISND